MRRTVSMSIGCVDTGCTTPLTLMLIGAPQEMKRSEACFSAISLNKRSRYIEAPWDAQTRAATVHRGAPARSLQSAVRQPSDQRNVRGFHDNVMKNRCFLPLAPV